MQALSDEYELSPSYNTIKNLTADISINIENGIRSNQLKREEDAAKNELTEKSIYEFVTEKSDFKKQKMI